MKFRFSSGVAEGNAFTETLSLPRLTNYSQFYFYSSLARSRS
ncbi:hypothetical protein Galf_0412 [Gallionella capsiferriformans ES-2]|jgi:hypothetical protein|uniref:Uncharacterized protein n=1 Tax=Gallionella capsiferriformans (strain ES-2) TaxID=395494 RepID=D9SJV7_GALCS|nr:hypothetical protein Galf_0412 [Gallionella capsiferriformans ES-2]